MLKYKLTGEINMPEIWDVYTKDRMRTGRYHERGKPMSEGDYHLAVLVWIFDSSGKILLTKRSPEKAWGGLWECTGGSALSGESSLEAALREVREEIGVTLDPSSGRVRKSFILEDSIFDVYFFTINITLNDLKLDSEEVSEARFVCAKELEKMFDEKLMVPTYRFVLELIEAESSYRQQ